ncbi:MAG: hypothetical protein V3V08_00450 [Nannocystaceae bacterium]
MRLPLRHPPPAQDPAFERCAYLEQLAAASVGVPLGATARALTARRSRGRHGNALQWHLGLDPHDSDASLDWEGRIEIKLVSVWPRRDGRVVCDKLKVGELGTDPWHKLANVLWIFADRLSRVVVGYRFTHLGGERRRRLARAWSLDPHFDRPPIFVEARQSGAESAPAYYLSARWFQQEGVLTGVRALYGFDARWWSAARRRFSDRDPAIAVTWKGARRIRCPRCDGSLRAVQHDAGGGIGWWAPALHELPLGAACAVRAHILIAGECLPRVACASMREVMAALEGDLKPSELWRLADRVGEPEDHMH